MRSSEKAAHGAGKATIRSARHTRFGCTARKPSSRKLGWVVCSSERPLDWYNVKRAQLAAQLAARLASALAALATKQPERFVRAGASKLGVRTTCSRCQDLRQ